MKAVFFTLLLWTGLSLAAEPLISFSEAQQAALGISTVSPQAISDNLSQRLPGEVTVPNARLQVCLLYTSPSPRDS